MTRNRLESVITALSYSKRKSLAAPCARQEQEAHRGRLSLSTFAPSNDRDIYRRVGFHAALLLKVMCLPTFAEHR